MFFTNSLSAYAGLADDYSLVTSDFNIYAFSDRQMWSGLSTFGRTIYVSDNYQTSTWASNDMGAFIYSSYIDIPISVEFKYSGLYTGRFMAKYKLDVVYKNGNTFNNFVRFKIGSPSVLSQYDDVTLSASKGFDDAGLNYDYVENNVDTYGTCTASFVDTLGVFCNDLVVSSALSGTGFGYVYPFVLRIPFTFTTFDPECLRLVHPDCDFFKFSITPLQVVNNNLYVDRTVKSSAGQVVDALKDNAKQAHDDAFDAKQQAQKNAQQAHEDAERAHEDSKNIFDKISDFFGGFFDNLINAVIGLFVPSDDDLSAFMDEMKTFLTDKLGFLGYPFEILGRLVSLVAKEGDANLTLPGFAIMGHVVWDDIDFDLTALMSRFVGLTEAIKVGTSVIIVGAFLLYCQKKFNEVLGGVAE